MTTNPKRPQPRPPLRTVPATDLTHVRGGTKLPDLDANNNKKPYQMT